MTDTNALDELNPPGKQQWDDPKNPLSPTP
jgi:hypothetical protein